MQVEAPHLNVYAARKRFSELLGRVEQGEQFIIARDGAPVAMLVPMPAAVPRPARVLGGYAGQIRWADDTFAPLSAEEQAQFEGPIAPDSIAPDSPE